MTAPHHPTGPCDERAGDLAAAAFGTLAPDEQARLDTHLATCPACSAELAQLRATVTELEVARAGSHAAPAVPTDLADAVLAAIDDAAAGVADATRDGATGDAAAVATPIARAARRPTAPADPHVSPGPGVTAGRSPGRARRWRPRTLAMPAFGAVAACAIAVLAVQLHDARGDADRLRAHVTHLEGDPHLAVLRGTAVTTLKTAGRFDGAHGQVAVAPDGGLVTLRKVPNPPAGMAWQVWQVDDDDHITSIGIVDSARDRVFLSLRDIDRDELKKIIVTAEPADGSEQPGEDLVAHATV